MNKFIGCLALLTMTTTVASAQSGTESPYSQFGLGDLADQGVGFNKAMSGVGLAFRKGNEVNPLNPASYSAVDSTTMIFDAGLSGQITNYKEGGTRLNAKDGGFDYVVGMFRLIKNVGVTFGVQPYSNIGYKYISTTLKDASSKVTTSYEGKGGLNQLFVGMGWRVAKPLSVGFNVAYLWGDYNKYIATSSSSTAINTLSKRYTADISSYKLELGVQYETPLNKTDKLTVGATFSPGHHLHADPLCQIINRNTTISKADTTSFKITDGLAVPTTVAVGVGYQRSNNIRVGADFQLQKWGSVDYPDYTGSSYVLKGGLLKDAYKMNVGAEWIPNPTSTRSVLHHVRYRVGAGYTTPYYYINGQDGPKDFHVSLGLGIPIMNGYNNRSVLNVSAQWQHRSADNLITENVFRLNIGLTFNERWFSKWKVE